MTASDATPKAHNRKASMDNVDLSPVAERATRGIVWDAPASPRTPDSPIGAYYLSSRSGHRREVIVETPETASLDEESGSGDTGSGDDESEKTPEQKRKSLWKAFGWGFVSFISLGIVPLILWLVLYCQAWKEQDEATQETMEVQEGTVSDLTATDDDTATRAHIATVHMREINANVRSSSKKKVACSIGSVLGMSMSLFGLVCGILGGMKIWPAEDSLPLPGGPSVNATPDSTVQLMKLQVNSRANPLAHCDPVKAIQCSAPDEPASDSNSNPIELTVLVSSGNKAVRNLNISNFGTVMHHPFLLYIHCERGFSSNCTPTDAGLHASVGIYKMYLHRYDNMNWIAASYSFPLYITADGYENATSLFTFNITEDEPVTSDQEHIVLDASVNTDSCASNLTQCMGPGHSIAAASSSNHNPIHMTIKVVWRDDGTPVDRLLQDDFELTLETAPDEEDNELEIYSFDKLGTVGVYDLFLDRKDDGNWVAGTYKGTIKVAFAGREGTTSFSFQIGDSTEVESLYSLEVTVNTAICALGPDECKGSNHSEIPATDGNHNPVQLSVVVSTPEQDNVTTANGTMVNDLAIENFHVSATSDPNEQPGSFKICDSSVCGSSRFVMTSDGFYQILLDRVNESNWDVGTYTGTVRVEKGAVYSQDSSFKFEILPSQT